MRTFLILAVLCGTAAADCVITGHGADEPRLWTQWRAVCDGTVTLSKPNDPSFEPAVYPVEGVWNWGRFTNSLTLTGDDVSFSDSQHDDMFEDRGAELGTRLWYYQFAGIGSEPFDYTVDPTTPLIVDGVTLLGVVRLGWYLDYRTDPSYVGIITERDFTEFWSGDVFGEGEYRATVVFGGVDYVSTVPEPSAFLLLATVALVPAAIAWRRSHNRLH